MCGSAGQSMERATQALLQADLLLAEQVISDHDEIVQRAKKTEEQALTVLALQAPVAGDLRAVVGALREHRRCRPHGSPRAAHRQADPQTPSRRSSSRGSQGLLHRNGPHRSRYGQHLPKTSSYPRTSIAQDSSRTTTTIWTTSTATCSSSSGQGVAARRGRRRRRDPPRPLLRAVRRPRRRDRAPRHLPGHRRIGLSGPDAASSGPRALAWCQ